MKELWAFIFDKETLCFPSIIFLFTLKFIKIYIGNAALWLLALLFLS